MSITLGEKRGKGFWKLNTAFLEDKEYIKLINETIINTVTTSPNENPQLLLCKISKINKRTVSITYAIRMSELRWSERSLLNEISKLEQ